MVFELGKYYEHSGGGKLHILAPIKTTMWGDTVVAESDEDACNLVPVGMDETSAQNWHEISKERWMESFS